jgi:hypothetical protein
MKKSVRSKTRDVAFPFRMGAGFPGDVNRTHPVDILAELIDAASPPTLYGEAVLVAAANAGVRPFVTGDVSQAAYGITVRPYPFQQSAATNNGAAAIGVVAPPVTGVIDVMRRGYIMVNLPAGGTTVKGGAVYVRVAASAGSNVMGAFEAAADGGNNVLLTNATFNGTPDANGNVEIAFNI